MIVPISFLVVLWISSVISSDQFQDEPALSNVVQLTFEGVNIFPQFSPDSRYITFTGWGDAYGNGCPQVFVLDLENPKEPPVQISGGIGINRFSTFVPDTNQLILEANFHATDFKTQFYSQNVSKTGIHSPCTDFPICNETMRSDARMRSLCESGYEIPPNLDIFVINEFGSVLAQLTGPKTNDDPLSYKGDATISRDGKSLVYSATCPESVGVCLYNIPFNTTDNKRNDPIKLKPPSMNKRAAYGSPSFNVNGTDIVFHGYAVPLNTTSGDLDQDALNWFNTMLSYNLFPTSFLQQGAELYTGKLTDTETPFKMLPNNAPSDIKEKLSPQFVGNTRTIMYTGRLKWDVSISLPDKRQLRLYDLDTGKDYAISSKQISTTMSAINANGTKIAFVSDRNNASKTLQIYVADFNLSAVVSQTEKSQQTTQQNSLPQEMGVEQQRNMERNFGVLAIDKVVHSADETYFDNVRQITFGGVNRKPYFSMDGYKISFHASGANYGNTDCTQVYQLDLRKNPRDQRTRRISTGFGRATSSNYFAGGWESSYSGDFLNANLDKSRIRDVGCQPTICQQNVTLADICAKPVQELSPLSHSFRVNQYGNIIDEFLRFSPDLINYDGRVAVAPNSKRVAITMKMAGRTTTDIFLSDVSYGKFVQVTAGPGFKGSASFSPDEKTLAYNAYIPTDEADISRWNNLIANNLIDASKMELYSVDISQLDLNLTNPTANGWSSPVSIGAHQIMFLAENTTGFNWTIDSDQPGGPSNTLNMSVPWKSTRLTDFGKASWAPYYLSTGSHIIFTSNKDSNNTHPDAGANLYMLTLENGQAEKLTHTSNHTFDGEATMSADGKQIAWVSSRNASQQGELNIFVADWVGPQPIIEPDQQQTTPRSNSASSHTMSMMLFVLAFSVILVS
ncbi:CRE-TAG-10 protein [Ditylenchus destructor]|uniref:CRE-TAG-10 protein n=1 Tax=Ditylenchus destructor TaxID=166010 RepID=A0AAD4NCW2_9BILA|nr:CRE-TAG-10 protein [Ditylenchus destructor]